MSRTLKLFLLALPLCAGLLGGCVVYDGGYGYGYHRGYFEEHHDRGWDRR